MIASVLTPSRYWNYSTDYKDPLGSPIFSSDPEIGFGSHGKVIVNEVTSAFKVDNGAFANFRVRSSRGWRPILLNNIIGQLTYTALSREEL